MNTTASATTTPGSCSTNCCPRSRRRRPRMAGRSSSRRTATTAHRRREQRGDLRVHRGVGTARCLQPRLQRDRHLCRPARRQRLSHADPQVRAEADPHLPAGRQQRPEHLRRRLVDGQPGDGARADLRRLRGQARLGRRAGTTASTPPRSSPTRCAGSGRTGPSRSRPATGSQQLQEILIPGEDWKLVAEATSSPKGRRRTRRARSSSTTSPTARPTRSASTARSSQFLDDTKKANGQAFGPDGRLYAVAGGAEQILAYDADGKPTSIADGFRGNDLVVRHDGGVYVTQPGRTATTPSKVWFISPKGEKKVVDTGLKFSNGDHALARSVAPLRRRQPHALGLQLPDSARRLAGAQAEVLPPARARYGRRQRRRRHARRPRRPAVCGHAAGHSGLRPGRPGELHHPDAERQGLEPRFGGEDFDTLYATCGDQVYRGR